MIQINPPIRGTDKHGSGEYKAPRGSRKHNGIDLAMYPDSILFSPVTGRVTKLGYPYEDDLRFRYVQITDEAGYDHRFFYVEPIVRVHETVVKGDGIGHSQKLGDRYPGITEHVHYEVKKSGEFVDPRNFL